ncbi:hypothetical protein [Desulfosarcina cetonica]|nr:hypothetical protein [Desulfosarcina cetonica]
MIRIGDEESRFENNGGKVTTARHTTVEGHLITLVTDVGSG